MHRKVGIDSELIGLLLPMVVEDGIHATPITGLSLVKASAPTTPAPVLYEPTICFIAQGAKEVIMDSHYMTYDASKFLIGAVDTPVLGAVIEASQESPFLCIVINLDLAVVHDLASRLADETIESDASALSLGDATVELHDAIKRLIRLIEVPQDRAVLSSLIIKEIVWRILNSQSGEALRQVCLADSRLAQIRRAIEQLSRCYRDDISIKDLAATAGMSESTFFQRFKSVTGTSPLRYRMRLRLMEAQRLILSEGLNAANAGFAVGYGSPSQFSREYAALFGLPPGAHAKRLRIDPSQSRVS